MTVVIGAVILVVNLEIEVDTGITRAPLGTLAVPLTELNVPIARVDRVLVDEDWVATFCKLSCVLPLCETGTASARGVVSDAEKVVGLGSVVESGDAEADDGRDRVGIYAGTRGGVGGWLFVSVTL